MHRKQPPDLNRLKKLYDYNPVTGHFIMREVPNKIGRNRGNRWQPGKIAGNHRKDSYTSISVDGKSWLAHRLAWYYTYDEWPDEIDHIDGNRSNNAISNLRNGGRATNNMNSAGWAKEKRKNKLPRGVYNHYMPNRYRAQIVVNSKIIHLGCFDTIDAAQKCYQQAAEKYFGDFAYHKRLKPILSGG